MSFQQGIVDRFTGALTGINILLDAAGLETISTTDGVLTGPMVEVTSWPYLIVSGPKWQMTGQASGSWRQATATMQVEIGICAADEATASASARSYGDLIRAGLEAYVPSGSVMMCECTSGTADGTPGALESGLPARLIRQTYRVTACYDHGQP